MSHTAVTDAPTSNTTSSTDRERGAKVETPVIVMAVVALVIVGLVVAVFLAVYCRWRTGEPLLHTHTHTHKGVQNLLHLPEKFQFS